MYSTANMTLTSWDLPEDDFDHTQLDANWKALDRHDHTAGRGLQIPTAGIATKAIVTGLINDAAITNLQMAADAVATDNIQDHSVTAIKLADGAVTGDSIAPGTITIDKLESHILPLGTVMSWYRGPGSGATPGGGWEIMDGRPWSAIPNLMGFTTGNIPNLVDAFARGTDLAHVGATGGANTVDLSHIHTVNAHSHSVSAHTHGIFPDGAHIHLWQGGLHMAARTNAFNMDSNFKDAYSPAILQNTYYTMYIANLLSNTSWFNHLPGGGTQQEVDGQADMDSAGAHSHGSTTGAAGSTTGSATPGTDAQLGATSILPSWVGLVFIMRVR